MNRIDLTGVWTLKQASGDQAIPANVPGDNYSALLAAGLVPEPYYGKNEQEVQWVHDRDWKYEREFEVSEKLLKYSSVYLNAEVLDTFAEIRVNGKKVASTRNMFKRHRLEVKRFLVPGINHISILFKSPAKEAEKESAKQPFQVPYSIGNNVVPHLNLVRKVQCHAGWDWGIALLVSGIYGDISLNGVNEVRIEHIYTEQKHGRNECEVTACAEIHSFKKQSIELEFEFSGTVKKIKSKVSPGVNLIKTSFVLDKPELWWPAGYGGQPLYELTVKGRDESISRKIGLRTIEVVQEKDELGSSMKFRVNGVDIFCKGANWIPADALPERQTPELYRNLLESAVNANMNMLRVWGGGQYEKEYFYEICDELGLLVWQDMMFACAQYPSTDDFLTNLEEELEYQIKRLKSHASVAIWCGDNECIATVYHQNAGCDNPEKYLLNYYRLSSEREMAAEKYGSEYTFWPSSPSVGPGEFNYAQHNKGDRGDMHYWKVWHGGEPFESFYKVIPRFCSEFGFQSFPSREVFDTFATEKDANVFSPVMEHHQKNNSGNMNIIKMFGRYFRMPDGFDNFLYLSQLQQALAIKTAVEFWRHSRPQCMGTLYWQLNDNWPVASWSSIEYGGKWKQLHYHARRFYAPLASMTIQKDDSLEVWTVNDSREAKQVSLKVTAYDFNGCELQSWHFTGRLAAGSSKKMKSLKLSQFTFALNEVFLHIETSNNETMHVNTHFFTPYKKCELPVSNIQSRVFQDNNGFRVELSCDKPAFFAVLETPGIKGVFSDNSVTLLPGQKNILFFAPEKSITVKEFEQALIVKHLSQSY